MGGDLNSGFMSEKKSTGFSSDFRAGLGDDCKVGFFFLMGVAFRLLQIDSSVNKEKV